MYCGEATGTIDIQHFWEIGDGTVTLERVLSTFRAMGWAPPRTYRVWECAYHRFFVMTKCPNGSIGRR